MKRRINVTNGAIVGAESTKRYVAEIKKAQVISREAETQLILDAQAGKLKARNVIIESNLRFAVQVARQYQGMGLEMEDLIAFANIGLFEAVDRFDTSKNVKFITFAVWYIRAEIQKALNDLSRTVRIPSHRTATEEYSTKSISTPVGDDENKETYADRYLAADEVRSSRDRADLKFDIDRVHRHN
jgi:RNA polymerase sigma factor (sigma-70 family)